MQHYNCGVPRVRLSELALLYCAAIWGSTFFVVKDTLLDVHPLALIGHRFALAGLLLLPLWWWYNRRKNSGSDALVRHSPGQSELDPEDRMTDEGVRPTLLGSDLLCGALLGAVIFALYAAQTFGLVWTTASNSAFITGLFIIFVPPLAFALHRNIPARHQLLAVAIACAGLYLLTGGLAALNRGDVLTLVAAATYALHVLLTGCYMAAGRDPLALATVQLLVCAVLSYAAAIALGAPLGFGTVQSAWMVLFLALFPTLSAYLLQLLAQRHVDPLRTSLIFTMEPVFGAAFAWTLGGEAFIVARAVGGLLIVVAMLVSDAALWRVTQRRSATSMPVEPRC